MSNANKETSRAFSKWIDTFVAEKGLDLEHTFDIDTDAGFHMIPVGCVVEAMKSANRDEQAGIKRMIVRIDFANGNVLDFFGHLAKGLAASYEAAQ